VSRIEIRRLASIAEYRECERLQMEVWGTLAAGSEVLQVTQKHGGVVLGTLANGKLLGFIYAFLGRYRGRLVHWSHMMAVAKGYRDQGLGFKMKLAHRELALQERIESICWTYDPLQSRNAVLNIARLGAGVEEYLEDCYGRFPSVIEKGLPSDRFVARWQIASAHVARCLGAPATRPADISLPKINKTSRNRDGFMVNRRLDLSFTSPRMLVEIPANTDEMRVRALKLARRWRLETRRMFQKSFESGCRIVDFVTTGDGEERRAFYILSGAGSSRRSI